MLRTAYKLLPVASTGVLRPLVMPDTGTGYGHMSRWVGFWVPAFILSFTVFTFCLLLSLSSFLEAVLRFGVAGALHEKTELHPLYLAFCIMSAGASLYSWTKSRELINEPKLLWVENHFKPYLSETYGAVGLSDLEAALRGSMFHVILDGTLVPVLITKGDDEEFIRLASFQSRRYTEDDSLSYLHTSKAETYFFPFSIKKWSTQRKPVLTFLEWFSGRGK